MEQVRTATAGDLPRLIELTSSFLDASGVRRGGGLRRPSDPGGTAPDATTAAVRPYVESDHRLALVGTLDGWVAGAVLCRADAVDGRTRGVVDLCFVEPGARGVGLGQELLERSLTWFGDRGCDGVDGTALPGDREAKQFFESAGFKARLLVMHRPLG